MKTKLLKLDDINIEGGTQIRTGINEDTVADYADKYTENDGALPPVKAVFDGTDHWLYDGFHRYHARGRAGKANIKAEVIKGTQRDAILLACGANSEHGLRRTNADKRKAVETLLNDEEWVRWADNVIADKAAVSQDFVSAVRSQLKSDLSSAAAKHADSPRIGKDGKARKPPKKKAVTSDSGDSELPTAGSSPGKGSAVSDYFDNRGPTQTANSERQPPGKPPKALPATADMPEAYVDDNEQDVPESLFPVWRQKAVMRRIVNDLRTAHGVLKRKELKEASALIEASMPSIVDGKNWLSAGEVE